MLGKWLLNRRPGDNVRNFRQMSARAYSEMAFEIARFDSAESSNYARYYFDAEWSHDGGGRK